MKYELLGKRIKTEREKRGWEQAELASMMNVGQQAVSRWETGKSRPRYNDLLKLITLFEADINQWLQTAGYQMEKPVRPLAPFLPLDRLSAENFELFSRDFVQALNPGCDVHRYGSQGDKQYGIDLYAKRPEGKLDYQCKRHKQFGPSDIDQAVTDTTLLGATVMQGARSGVSGQPFPEDLEQRDRSYELLSKLPVGSPAQKFYKSLYEAAKANIVQHTNEDGEF